jgi:coenzyme F420-dependent glucose-6-phosphate dehydrogenase
MGRVGYHASHERFAPSRLLNEVKQAEAAGFQAAMCSDHFHPWSEQQGQSGFTWSWLGAAMASTNLSFGTVSAPGQRYHPAILAQAAATLSEMYPGRLWLAAATGQLLSEGITGDRWPAKDERRARLREAVDVMRALWRGETVTHHGLIRVEQARLYTLPQTPPALLAAALTMETAEWAGSWADGLITVNCEHDQLCRMIEAFRKGGGASKPIYVQANHVYWDDAQEAQSMAYQAWRTNLLGASLQADLRSPAQYEAAAQFVRPEDIHKSVRISIHPDQHIRWLQQDFDAGIDTVLIHFMGPDQKRLIELFAEDVLPAFEP